LGTVLGRFVLDALADPAALFPVVPARQEIPKVLERKRVRQGLRHQGDLRLCL